MKKIEGATTTNLGRHAAECKICAHGQREDIERDFINWRSPAAIAKSYKLTNRASVYRHAHAYGLFSKRQRNVRAALEKIIERAGVHFSNFRITATGELNRYAPETETSLLVELSHPVVILLDPSGGCFYSQPK
jgi:hypothetical protein